MFRVLQWADSHLNNTAVAQVNSLIPVVPDLDLPVHCGDVTRAYYEQGTGSFDGSKSTCVIGNHDAIKQAGTQSGSYDWTVQPTQNALYNDYLAIARSAFDLDMSVNTTWWCKEFPDKNVMFIGLNDCVFGSDYTNELAWLKNKLDYAESKGYALAVGKHLPSTYATVDSDCVFSSKYMKSASYASDTSSVVNTYNGNPDSLMKAIIDSECDVLYVLAGHEHADALTTITRSDGTKIPYIVSGSCVVDQFNDVARGAAGYTSHIVCNMVDYVPESNSLHVFRLGADGCKSGIPRKMIAWSYADNKVVATCGRS